MKRLLLILFSFLVGAGIAQAQTNTFCASNLPCNVSGSWNMPSVNNIITVDGVTYPRTCAGLNSAIQAAPVGSASNNPNPSGSIIYLGYGDIPCSVTVLIDRPITLRGSGFAGRFVPQPGFAGPVLKADCSDGKGAVNQFGACIGSRLENIWIEDTAFRSQNTDGIWLIHQDEFMMYNVEVKWLKGYALQLDNNGNNNTPVRESVFRNFVSWGNGDPAQSKASIMMITNSFAGSDEINEIRFDGGGVKYEWWEAVRIGTGQTCSGICGPRHIYFHNFQIEARQDLDCAGGGCTGGIPLAVAPLSDNFHVLQANNITLDKVSVSNAGQGKSSVRIDGVSGSSIQNFTITDSVIGGAPQLTGNLTCTAVANSVCTWVSGNQFQPNSNVDWAGLTISIPAAACTTSCVVSSQQSVTQLTLTTNTGAITNVPYTVTSGGWGVTTSFVSGLLLQGVRWLTNPLGNLNPTIANTGAYTYVEVPGGPIAAGNDPFGLQQCLGTDCGIGYKNNSTPNGQEWVIDSQSGGGLSIFPRTTQSTFNLGGIVQLNNANFHPAAVNTTDIGSTALPFVNLWIGTAATNNFKFQPAATAQATTITIADPALASVGLPLKIASGTSTMTAGAVTAATCQAAITTAATGTATTDSIEWAYATAPTLTTDALLTIAPYVTSGNVNFTRCNPTNASITGTAIVINWRVLR